jgi:WD40 repeat protein
VLSDALLYWFAFRPFIALYFPPGNGYNNSAVAFSPGGHTRATAEFKSVPPAQNQETSRLVHIDIWDASSSIKLHTFEGSDPIAFSPDGRTLATGSQDNHAILLWNVSSGTLLHSFASHNQMSSLVFSPDGHTLVSGSNNGAVEIWDPSNGPLLRTLG